MKIFSTICKIDFFERDCGKLIIRMSRPTKERVVKKIKDKESIFRDLEGEFDLDYYNQTISNLVDTGLLVEDVDSDEDAVYYSVRDGMRWPDIVKQDCPLTRRILLLLVDNPQTFFVLYNTQKGKFGITTNEICKWKATEDKKVVAFLIVDNDKTLADQCESQMEGLNLNVFLLSSDKSEVTMGGIQMYIDAYAADDDGEYKMPVIISLNNAIQIKKVTALMNHIKSKVERRKSHLRYGIIFDEADRVYPGIRDKFLSLIVEDNNALHRLGFVTATEGELLVESDYPECSNAYMYPVPPGNPDYRAIHTDDAQFENVPNSEKLSNDMYAETIISKYRDHFNFPVTLKNGSEGFRKIIVNGGTKTSSMDKFALKRVSEGYYVMTLNMHGVNVYRPGHEKKRYSAKGVRLNQLLFNIYVELKLYDRPLFIIGRRKVDRGLSFHYAPPDGTDGLIWTDMILGCIEDVVTATQKAGRLAGKVAQCPQYPGELIWWTDEKTYNSVLYHNKVVDKANTKNGYSVSQAVSQARTDIPLPYERETLNDTLVSEGTFGSYDEAKSWGRENLDKVPCKMCLCDENGNRSGRTHFFYRKKIPILSEQETRACTDMSYGLGSIKENGERTSGSPRIRPVFVNDEIRFVVIYKRFNIRT